MCWKCDHAADMLSAVMGQGSCVSPEVAICSCVSKLGLCVFDYASPPKPQ